MPVLRVLLQAILCLAVLLNGAGIAVAGTTMDMADAQAQLESSASGPAAAHAVCPDDASGEEAVVPGSAEDCSMSASCDFACGLHVVLPAVAPGAIAPLLPAAPAARAGENHAPPVLVHLTRPPIR